VAKQRRTCTACERELRVNNFETTKFGLLSRACKDCTAAIQKDGRQGPDQTLCCQSCGLYYPESRYELTGAGNPVSACRECRGNGRMKAEGFYGDHLASLLEDFGVLAPLETAPSLVSVAVTASTLAPQTETADDALPSRESTLLWLVNRLREAEAQRDATAAEFRHKLTEQKTGAQASMDEVVKALNQKSDELAETVQLHKLEVTDLKQAHVDDVMALEHQVKGLQDDLAYQALECQELLKEKAVLERALAKAEKRQDNSHYSEAEKAALFGVPGFKRQRVS
jgi:hypothetical protein